MRTAGPVETVSASAAFVSCVVLHMSLLPIAADAVSPNTAAAFRAPHPPAARHLQSQFDLHRLPAAVCVQLRHDHRTNAPITFAISTMFVLPVKSNFTLPSPEKYSSSSASRSSVPAVSTENATILL
jgi:hypothetical protein